MKIQIKCRFTANILFETEADTIKAAVNLAIEKKINLSRANLSGANLRSAYLSGANLRSAYLSDANLSGADLSRANLSDADLSDADLSDADLSRANLSDADLSDADLSDANLSGADLSRANLSDADLSDADLSDADLSRANLSGANLRSAYLSRADLSRADLRSANLRSANLRSANLNEIKNMPIFQIVPELGPFYAFKKLREGVIATLYVPRSAGRVNSTGRKCRVEKAKVIALTKGATEAYDNHSGKLLYKLECWVKPDSFNSDIREECTNGIHCFITKKEAEDYV